MPPWPPAKPGLDAGKWSCKDPRRLEPATWFPARPRAGARLSLKESRRKEHQGGERFSPPWTHLSLVCDQREVFSMFRDWPAALYPTPVTARPPAGRAGRGGFADGKGRPCTQPFLVEAEKGGSRLSPQRNFSPSPLGNPVAPSSVTFGDSFPPRGSLWVVQPYTKKASQIRARRWATK